MHEKLCFSSKTKPELLAQTRSQAEAWERENGKNEKKREPFAMLDVVATKSGVIMYVRTQPGSSKNRIIGEYGGRLKLAVTAAPEKGKANKAVVELLARALRICESSIQIVSGESSRNKKLIIEGVSPGDIHSFLNVPAQ